MPFSQQALHIDQLHRKMLFSQHSLKCAHCGKKCELNHPRNIALVLICRLFSSTISGRLYQQKKVLRFDQLFWDQSVSRVDLQGVLRK